ncbi:MAG TPA: hypothetical protein VJW51_08405 [Candidatus Acidoferrales bacterium]|nr:hypothetical protein [Candidatus Acidoferrales bacterium]
MRIALSHVILMLVVSAVTLVPMAESQRSGQACSMTVTRGPLIAAESPLAAQAGAQVLSRGRSAVDAAITANAVMGVVSPMMNGIVPPESRPKK